MLLRGVQTSLPQTAEPFILGAVASETDEPFSILGPLVAVDTDEPFSILGPVGVETVEPFALGEHIWVDSIEDFSIIASSSGGYLGGTPAAPLMGWRKRA